MFVERKVRFKILLRIPEFLTLGAVICGMLSIILAAKRLFVPAAFLLLATALIDWLDGQAAVYIRQKGRFGIELDSLTDSIGFAAAPALFGYFLGLDDLLSVVILIIFAVASILRLARFNVVKKTYTYYIGLATITNAIGLPLLYFLIYYANGFFNLSWSVTKTVLLGYYLLVALLLISSVKIKALKILRL